MMKKMITLFVCLLFATSIFVAVGCAKKEEPPKPAEPAKAAEPQKKAEEAKLAEKAPGHGEEWTAVQKEIWELEKSRWNSLIGGNLDGFVKYHHEDGAFWPYWSDKPLNREEFRANLGQFTILSADLKPCSIKVFGNIAIVQYTCEYMVTQRGMINVPVKSRFTEIRMRQNGIWQVIGKMLHKVN